MILTSMNSGERNHSRDKSFIDRAELILINYVDRGHFSKDAAKELLGDLAFSREDYVGARTRYRGVFGTNYVGECYANRLIAKCNENIKKASKSSKP